MRVLIDARPLQELQLTGVGRYTYDLLNELASTDHKYSITLLIVGRKKPSVYVRDIASKLSADILRLSWPSKLLTFCWSLNLPPYFRQGFSDFDLLYILNLNYFPLKYLPKKILLTIHDLSFIHQPKYFSLKSRLWHKGLQLKRLLAKSTAIIAVSNSTKNELLNYFPVQTKDKITAIQSGVQNNDKQPEQKYFDFSLPDNYLLTLGTLEERKNIVLTIQAFNLLSARYPDLYLLIAGKKGRLDRTTMHLIEDNKRCIWLKYVSAEQKNQLYSNARIFIWPSHYEGFGFPPLEAEQAGRPIICSYKTSLPEIMEQRAVYCHSYNSAELAEIISQLLKSKPQIAKAASKIFSWSQTAAEVNQLLINL